MRQSHSSVKALTGSYSSLIELNRSANAENLEVKQGTYCCFRVSEDKVIIKSPLPDF